MKINYQTLSNICFLLGLVSVIASIVAWNIAKGTSPEELAHAERWGIFIGLWAPTFITIANWLKNKGSS